MILTPCITTACEFLVPIVSSSRSRLEDWEGGYTEMLTRLGLIISVCCQTVSATERSTSKRMVHRIKLLNFA
jgi:hypothetical protein